MWPVITLLDNAGREYEIPSPWPDSETLPDLDTAFSFSPEYPNHPPATCSCLQHPDPGELLLSTGTGARQKVDIA